MIKNIKKFQIKLTPFDATKEWNMSTTNNQDVLLIESTSSVDETAVGLEFIDYGGLTNTSSFDNSECDIALEQQPDDLLNDKLGLNVSGLFYPQLDPVNEDGTYKRVIFSQVRTMFYNQFHDPTKTWGMNNIDFDLSKTKRKISDEIRLFDVPQSIYGDQIIPNTITLTDDSLDDVFSIVDDGNGNLIAGNNLFSHKQEVGKFINSFLNGADSTCYSYFGVLNVPYTPTLLLTAPNAFTNSLSWSLNIASPPAVGFNLERSVNDQSNFTSIAITSNYSYADFPVSDSSTTYYYRVRAYNLVGSSSYSQYSNIVFTANIVEPWNEYTLNQSQSFNSGSGWATAWFVDTTNRLVASESWNEYSVNQGTFFNGGFGWYTTLWYTASVPIFLAASESWDEYTVGQTTNFNSGYRLSGSNWYTASIPIFLAASESWDEYFINQTQSFNSGFGLINSWSNSSGSI